MVGCNYNVRPGTAGLGGRTSPVAVC